MPYIIDRVEQMGKNVGTVGAAVIQSFGLFVVGSLTALIGQWMCRASLPQISLAARDYAGMPAIVGGIGGAIACIVLKRSHRSMLLACVLPVLLLGHNILSSSMPLADELNRHSSVGLGDESFGIVFVTAPAFAAIAYSLSVYLFSRSRVLPWILD